MRRMRLTAGRRLAGVTLAVTALICASVLGSQPASALNLNTARGTIFCPSRQPVVGVWVNAGSASGWASYNSGGYIAGYYKGLGIAHPTYNLTVGCGGTPQHWGSTNYETGTLLSGYDFNVICNGRGACYAFSVDVP